jgi:hypothetical protein
VAQHQQHRDEPARRLGQDVHGLVPQLRLHQADQIFQAVHARHGGLVPETRPTKVGLAPVLALPGIVAGAVAKAADALAWLGWLSPMRSAAISQLRHGVRGDPVSAAALPSVHIRSLDQLLAATPSGVQERWFARLYFLKPIGLTTLAVFWAASGVGGVLAFNRAAAILTPAGFPPVIAADAVGLGSAADLALALLVCHRATTTLALKGMILVSAGYLLGVTLWRPDLWTDPLGPLIKIIPTMVPALVMLALMEAR